MTPTQEESLAMAHKIVQKSFADKKDLVGVSYMQHLKRVHSNFVDKNSHIQIVALLHDLLEDCPEWNAEVLRHFFNEDIVRDVVTLTKLPDEPYEDYIERIKPEYFARKVKLADLKDNMDITRLDSLSSGAVKRLKKYHMAYRYLKANDAD